MPRTTKTSNNKELTARVRSRNQLTLPQSVVNATGLTEGSFVSVSVSQKRTTVPRGWIILSPQRIRPWTDEEWLKKEAEADEDIRAGRLLGPYKGADELITAMRRDLKDLKKKRRRK